MCLKKLPGALQIFVSAVPPSGFQRNGSGTRLLIRRGGEYDLTEREILLEHVDNCLCRVWALNKTRKHCQTFRQGWENVIPCVVWTALSRLWTARPRSKLKLVKRKGSNWIKDTPLQYKWEWKGVFLSAKKLEVVPVGVSEQSWREEWPRWRAANALEPET